MLFNSIDFFIFLIIVLTVYYSLSFSVRFQNIFLLIASYFFYGWWDYRFTSLILLSSVLDFYCGKKIQSSPNDKKKYLIMSLVGNLGVLAFFKYFNFFISSFSEFIRIMGLNVNPVVISIVLPIGISFYTFQTLAYTIDVYRGDIVPSKNFIDFALYVSFFPQLVAGPIERPTNLLKQISNKRHADVEMITSGIFLIVLGLFKKVAIADYLAVTLVEEPFTSPNAYDSISLWIGVYAFALQIYGDFSGYTDTARGVARILGFELMENFQHPYFSTNITDFWRRWHVSLSTWLRDYLYIPLGGSRKGKNRTYYNLMVTMLLGGLWHGASWKFVIWGGLHGLYLTVHKLLLRGKKHSTTIGSNFKERFFGVIKIGLTFNVVCLTWVFFRAKDFTTAMNYLYGMLSFHINKISIPIVFIYGIIAILVCDIPQYASNDHLAMMKWPPLLKGLIITFMLLAILFLHPSQNVPFIYFQF